MTVTTLAVAALSLGAQANEDPMEVMKKCEQLFRSAKTLTCTTETFYRMGPHPVTGKKSFKTRYVQMKPHYSIIQSESRPDWRIETPDTTYHLVNKEKLYAVMKVKRSGDGSISFGAFGKHGFSGVTERRAKFMQWEGKRVLVVVPSAEGVNLMGLRYYYDPKTCQLLGWEDPDNPFGKPITYVRELKLDAPIDAKTFVPPKDYKLAPPNKSLTTTEPLPRWKP